MGQKYTNISDLYKQVKLNEREIIERKLTSQELEDRERIAKKLPMADFKKRYGKDAMAVKMAVATNMAKAKNETIEDELGEKYNLYHSTFSGAMQHAYDYAKKKMGITVDPKEIDNKVATGPKKPTEGKTNKYRLKGKGGNLQIQVYNKGGSKPFELNMYKEEVELDEKLDKEDEPTIKKVVKMLKKASGAHAGQAKDLEKAMTEEDEIDEGKMSQLHQLMKDGKSAKEIAKIMKLDVKTIKALIGEELKEESARADAMRAMRRGKEVDPADVDDAASDDDVKAASKNIIMQLRKSVSLRGNFPVEFMDKKKVKVDAKIASAAQKKYNSMRKADDKEKFQAKIAKSYKDMLAALKEGFASDAQRRAAFAQGYKAKGKKGKKEDAILDRIGKKLKERKNG